MKLERLEKRRDEIKSLLNKQDDYSKNFYGGRVGFKSGSSKKKHEAKIEKELDLIIELKEVESKIERIKNPLVRSKTNEVSPNTLSIGQIKYHLGVPVEVVRINKKTVTVQYKNSDFKEAIKPHLLD